MNLLNLLKKVIFKSVPYVPDVPYFYIIYKKNYIKFFKMFLIFYSRLFKTF